MASDEHLRRVIEEIEKMRRHIRNSRLTLKRRINNFEKTFDPLERGRIELEIELLKRKIVRWEILETRLSISIMKATLFQGRSKDGIDWSKAGRA